MSVELDNLHYNWRDIDGYGKAYNFAMGPREPGKTSMMWLTKIYLPWKKDHRPWIYLVRKSVEINDALIESIFSTIINKFTDDNVSPTYKRGTFNEGITDVSIDGKLFFRIVALGIDLRRIKLAVLPNIKGVFMDEYIIDPKTGEKYATNEAFKIKEAYTTWRRECDGQLRMYFAGNPYSLFNPLFVDWGIEISRLKKDQFYVGDNFVVHWCTLHPKLVEKLLRDNPNYQFDEDYRQYALEGMAINDSNIKLGTLPPHYSLQYSFRFQNKYIGVFKNNFYEDMEDKYFCKFLDGIGKQRTAYCLDFEDMLDRTIILSIEERNKLKRFKNALRMGLVAFEDINVYYYLVEIYKGL